ncbi:MBL fold metallo-hydrolase [Pelosinus propionicus]|uniref:L-ascorbate metabolism protein UlaG, beta-lactamase superfamily n=1 Tax=Pelosinus propionicus DSM 13327 TaxID=1123291 RepID=A0A1I4J3S8_9FIRM|nr:MBL fold metallo-hydrolase [Pelosinus propionicus]SFL60746.1 L-ascorbate metabolism protein UlaG, beta-lactamase superfamily [Pelosinus propionicus DSM 13327]
MKMKVQMELIANSGVFIKVGESTILVDGIFGESPFFSQPVSEIQKAVFGTTSKYKNINYLIFTHRHIDHFSSVYLDKYISNNEIKKVYMPKLSQETNSFEDKGPLLNLVSTNKIQEFYAPFGELYKEELIQDCTLTCFRSVHMGGREYQDTRHYTIMLTIEEENYIFAADADYMMNNFEAIMDKINVTAVFINPLFLSNSRGQNILDRLKPERVVIYHIPFENEDKMGLRKLVAREILKYKNKPYKIIALTEKDQRLE